MSLSAMRSARLAADGLLVNSAPFKLRPASHATAIVAVPTGALSALDNADLARCEKVINAGLTTFFEVGRALLTIKIKQLYRRDCATFEEYCRKRWDMSRFYAYRLINAAEVRQRLLTIGNIPLPKNEAQARPLTRLTPDLVPKVWRKAVEMANGEEVSQKHVAQAARQVQEASQRRKPLNGKTTHTQDSHSVVLACRMMREMRKCLLAGETEQVLFTLEKLKLTLERMATDSKRGVEDEEFKHDS